ncbi:tRNA1(Val) (adenine(37)-N6)-methyltransferase [Treponema zioleckii]|uniref:tRNA1(Val) (adenine(37)-N6)-methyltransferase n=1 Tax=Treponema zioleckii TaxID=331680 RepID=UPI00168A4E75|nr:tRNA1(Val) (adenine(37)-N6)-methyltransferase [Treponema zioleckii]
MEQIENLHIPGYKIVQDKEKFCFGIDAVLLSSFARVHPNDSVMDLCTGNAIVPILMSAKNHCNFTALELQEDSIRMAKKSVELNHLEDRINVLQGDLKNVRELFAGAQYDVVTVNPPYMRADSRLNPNEAKNIARHEIFCSVNDVVWAAACLLKSGGSLFMIHRPERLSEIFRACFAEKMEPKRMRFVQSFSDSEPSMVLIEARKFAKADLKIEKPVVIYERKGVYSKEIESIYGR